MDLVSVSRLQFATTAIYHFLFVPLTIGLVWIILIMESSYVITGNKIYKDMTQFWGKLFGINFAMGVATGLTMEFQFGTNWAYYSHYVGDIFGIPLALEGMSAFFLESTFVGMFFFAWDRLSKEKHLMCTFFLAIGTTLSALWILIANGWMNNPIGSEFNYHTMRMELTSLSKIVLNPSAQNKFAHTMAASFVTGSTFILSISAYYLLKRRDVGFSLRSSFIASIFGSFSVVLLILMGDQSGYDLGITNPMKLAAIEAEWETQKAPADMILLSLPDNKNEVNHYELKIPYLMGLLVTRSTNKQIIGIKDLEIKNKERIKNGITAYRLLLDLRNEKALYGKATEETIKNFDRYKDYLGYGLLLKKYNNAVIGSTEEQINKATLDSKPNVFFVFWSFRIMVGLGVLLFIIFISSMIMHLKRNILTKGRLLLIASVLSIPMPWISSELGWVVAEVGRQPWTIVGILPTFFSTSDLPAYLVRDSLICFVVFYTFLLVVELYLMFKYIGIGPSSLGLGKYHFEEKIDIKDDVNA